MSEKSEQKACVSKCIMDRDLEIAKRFSLEGWEGVVRLSKECLAFSKWVSSPACYLMKDDDDDCVEFLKSIQAFLALSSLCFNTSRVIIIIIIIIIINNNMAAAAQDMNNCRVVLKRLDLSAYTFLVSSEVNCDHHQRREGGRWRDARAQHWRTCLSGIHPRHAEKRLGFWTDAERTDCLGIVPSESTYLNSKSKVCNSQWALDLLLRPEGIGYEDTCIQMLMEIPRYRKKAQARMRSVILVVETALACPDRKASIEADPYWILLRHRIQSRFPDPRKKVLDMVAHYHYAIKSTLTAIPFHTMI